ncbi:AMP-binding protein [Halioxenophilus aromaticivorans]|uniref:Cyclohexanecarboxylate-CoA ligase n=1 Tax=Halioxenophilus aromaticivorans TaxID=1306992 RepID=A0AAV3TW46_9ALTE
MPKGVSTNSDNPVATTTQNTTYRKTIHGWSIRWDDALAKNAYENGYWSQNTLATALQTDAENNPNREIIIEGNIRLTARSLHEESEQLAKVLANRFAPGSVISFMLPNWHETAIIYLAATYAGLVAHPILPSLREHDLLFMLSDVNSKMLFIPQQFRNHQCADMLERVVEKMENPPEVIVVRGDRSQHLAYETLLDQPAAEDLAAVDAESVRMVMYTSGTTGRPKGVLHTHNSINALIKQLGDHWLVEPGDKFLVASPISHIGGSIYAFEIPILLGASAVLMESWQSDEAVELLLQEGCTHFAGATPFLTQTLQSAKKVKSHLPDLKVFICGGASVPPSLIYEASDYFAKAAVTRAYGSTEVPVMSVGVLDTNDVKHAAETDGKPGLADIILARPDGEASETGEVIAKGPQMLAGFLHTEDEANAFTTNGYYKTGDLACWQDDSFLVINGRLKDIIIRNGENIAPKEIEDLLVDLPQIKEVAIVGLPDPKTGERACAVIVAAQGQEPDINTLVEHLAQLGVAKFKYPERVELWSALPKNDAGKVLKHKIKEIIEQADKEAS